MQFLSIESSGAPGCPLALSANFTSLKPKDMVVRSQSSFPLGALKIMAKLSIELESSTLLPCCSYVEKSLTHS